MSLETWLAEFYSIPAHDLQFSSDLECIDHCLLKWRGAEPKNTKKHDVAYSYHRIVETVKAEDDKNSQCNIFDFHTSSCALCKKYPDTYCQDANGNSCPFIRFTGERCDTVRSNNTSPWHASSIKPQSMINAITALRVMVEQENLSK